jgi:chromosome segregation ATPase
MRSAKFLAFALAVLGAAPAASAQTIEDRLRQQLVSTTAEVQQLQDEQASLQTQKLATEKERDDLKKQLAEAQAQISRLKHNSGPSEESVAQYKDALDQATEKARQSAASRDQIQAEATKAAAKLGKILDACQTKNDQLFSVANRILNAYQNQDFSDDSDKRESFVIFRHVELENAIQAYEDALRDAKFDLSTVLPPTSTSQTNVQNASSPKNP